MSDIQKQREDLKQQIRDAQRAESERVTRETENQRQIAEARAQLAALDQQERARAFNAQITESQRLADENLSAAREMIAAIERHDLDGAIEAARRTHAAYEHLFQHNRAALVPNGGLAERNDFQRFSWGVALETALPVALAGITGDELWKRNVIVFGITRQTMQVAGPYTFVKATENTRSVAYRIIVRGEW